VPARGSSRSSAERVARRRGPIAAIAGVCLWVVVSGVLAAGVGASGVSSGEARQAGLPARSARAASEQGAWQPHVETAIAYAHTRAGEVSFDVRTEQRQWGWRATRTVPSASVLKAMLLVAYLDDPRVRDRPLRASDRGLIDPMIERSDNEAATSVLGFVGASEVDAVARRARMREFRLDPTIWGLSRIDAADQARFFLHIDREVVARHRAAAMHLLASVVPSQRWGIGQIELPGWQVYFKGGWGAGTGEVEHQVVLLRHGSVRVSLAVLITDSPSHEYAKRTLQGVFERLLRGVGRLIAAPSG
jgi:Beta-lactamase enzyme family